MKKQLGVLAISVLAASISQANSFVIQDAVGNAMGGAGIANDDTVGYGNNPALLINDQRNHFAITLPSVGVFVEDGKGFIPTIEKFVNDDIDTFTSLNMAGLPTAIGDVNTAVGVVNAAAATYGATQNAANLQALADANADLSTKIGTVNTEVASVDNVVTTTQSTFNNFSGKPMQAGLMAGMGLAVPNVGFPMSVTASNNSYAGFQFELVANDLSPLNDTLTDVDEYLVLVQAVTDANTGVISAAAVIQDEIDNGSGIPTGPQLTALTNAQTALTTAESNLAAANTTNGVFVGGAYTGTAGNLDVNTMTSSINMMLVNVTEAGFATAREMELGGIDFITGVNLKVQNLVISGADIAISDMANDAAAQFDAAAGASQSHMVFNADIGFTKTLEFGFGEIESAVVIKDLVPYTLTTPASVSGDVEIKPALRVGVSHQTPFSTIVADLDITKNTPLGYGSATQYFNIGGELSAWGLLNVRAGLKSNLAASDDKAVTMGTGFGLFGVALDFSGWFNPSSTATEIAKNAGFMAQFSTKW